MTSPAWREKVSDVREQDPAEFSSTILRLAVLLNATVPLFDVRRESFGSAHVEYFGPVVSDDPPVRQIKVFVVLWNDNLPVLLREFH